MKPHVVNQELFRVIHGSEHSSQFFRHRSHLISGSTFSRKSGNRHLERPTRFKHFSRRESLKRGHQTKRTTVERGRTLSLNDKRSRTAAWLQHTDSGK